MSLCLHYKRASVALMMLMMYAFCVQADALHLKNGAVINGTVQKYETVFTIVTESGITSRIPLHEVIKWEKKKTRREEYKIMAVAVEETVDAHYQLGKWCKRNSMPEEAKWHYMMAVAIDPADVKSRKAAGYVWDKATKSWMLYTEHMDKRGYVKFKNKWMRKTEAMKIQIAEKSKAERKANSKKAWSIAGAATRNDKTKMNPYARKLIDMGEGAMGVIERCLMETDKRKRELAFLVLGRKCDQKSRKLLMKRMRTEKNTRLVSIIGWELAYRPDRLKTLTGLLHLAIKARSKTTRKRAYYALLVMGDERAIDSLINYANYNPISLGDDEVQIKNADDSMKGLSSGTMKGTAKTSHQKPRKAYFPAASALEFLTNQRMGNNKEHWTRWWNLSKKNFSFRPVVKPSGYKRVEVAETIKKDKPDAK